MPEPHLTIRAVQPVVAALEALGRPAKALLAAAGIPPAMLEQPEGRVPQSAVMQLWRRALDATGDANLGIHLAELAPVRSFEVHAYAMLGSPTLREAYLRACRYQRLIHETNSLTLEKGPREAILRHALPDGSAVPRHPAEFLATLWVRFGRLISGEDWAPSLVCFAHQAPADTSEHARVFRCTLQFASGRTAMHVPNALLNAPNPGADASLVKLLDRYAESLLERLPQQATLAGRLRAWLITRLPGGEPAAEAAAKALAVSVRSLHRGLSAEGTSFRKLLDQLRHEKAAALLAGSECSIAEVAFLLGFSEPSSFYRAFRRWTGKTPVDYRAAAPSAVSSTKA